VVKRSKVLVASDKSLLVWIFALFWVLTPSSSPWPCCRLVPVTLKRISREGFYTSQMPLLLLNSQLKSTKVQNCTIFREQVAYIGCVCWWWVGVSYESIVVVIYGAVSCCMRRTCWSFTSRGLCTVGQDDIVILLECLPDETLPPTDVFQHIALLYDQASQGIVSIILWVSGWASQVFIVPRLYNEHQCTLNVSWSTYEKPSIELQVRPSSGMAVYPHMPMPRCTPTSPMPWQPSSHTYTLADWSDFGLLEEKSSLKWEISCPGCKIWRH